jgi:hypothetical protein
MQRYSFLDIQAFVAQLYRDPASGQGINVTLVPYGYTSTFLDLAQGQTLTNSLNITANADFVLTGLKYRAGTETMQTVSDKTAAFVRVLLTDSGSNEQFTNQAVDVENYSTNGGDSRDLPYPRLIQGRTSLTIQATNYSPDTGETYTTLDLYLEGVLVRKV